MKHKDAQAFVRKYNSELAIKGYSKMKKADLAATIERKLGQSRKELKQEWAALKAGPRPMAVKRGPKAKQMGVKTAKRPPSVPAARSAAAQARARAGAGMKKPAVKKPAKKKPAVKKPSETSRAAENRVDDTWHSRNKDVSGQAQANRVNSVVDRLQRRAAVQRDTARVRRMRSTSSALRNPLNKGYR